mmetsp:Transcript_13030/g.52169  ORF Transcript_13030/g.52169 Transcript_13030/m.52169 type:complete len:379 (+) Transcript_13030:1535-2671(+)
MRVTHETGRASQSSAEMRSSGSPSSLRKSSRARRYDATSAPAASSVRSTTMARAPRASRSAARRLSRRGTLACACRCHGAPAPVSSSGAALASSTSLKRRPTARVVASQKHGSVTRPRRCARGPTLATPLVVEGAADVEAPPRVTWAAMRRSPSSTSADERVSARTRYASYAAASCVARLPTPIVSAIPWSTPPPPRTGRPTTPASGWWSTHAHATWREPWYAPRAISSLRPSGCRPGWKASQSVRSRSTRRSVSARTPQSQADFLWMHCRGPLGYCRNSRAATTPRAGSTATVPGVQIGSNWMSASLSQSKRPLGESVHSRKSVLGCLDGVTTTGAAGSSTTWRCSDVVYPALRSLSSASRSACALSASSICVASGA